MYQSSEKSFVFGSRRLPFGWFFSPILGQKTLERILLPLAAWFPDLMWQFIDDILLGHPDPYFLSFACAFAVYLLEKSGLLMSPKSQLVPSTHITWLGKDISCKLLCNSYTRVSQVLLHLWLLRCLRFSFRSLARLLGHLQWLCAPASTCAPFLASAYALLHTTSRPILLPRNIWRALATACLTSLLPLSRRPIPPPTCMPLVYCDAALTPSGRYAVSCFKRSFFATHVTAPA